MDAHNHDLTATYAPPERLSKESHVSSLQQYKELYEESVNHPEKFWGEISKQFYWKSGPTGDFLKYNFDFRKGKVFIEWMKGAITNICYNVLDHQVNQGNGDKIAFLWEGNDPEDSCSITYGELQRKVCIFSNVLRQKGVQKGDRVAIYMPMVIELVVAMLSCARIGAIHSIVFAGFSPTSLAERILDSHCCMLITADGVFRGKKLLNLKEICDDAVEIVEKEGHKLKCVICFRHLSTEQQGSADVPSRDGKRPYADLQISWNSERDVWWHESTLGVSEICEPEWMDAEDPLFMLYTSGSTGKPKGVLHTVAGYMLYAATTFKYDFDHQIKQDVYWCTADIGWITGHTYVVYGPMANGATSVMFEGTPFYPDAGRCWDVVQKYKVSKFYTAPTLVRSLMKYEDSLVTSRDLSSLKVLGTVGEPINPEAWLWYHKVVGGGRCAVVDTFWQTETGGHTITPLPGATPTKPGSATFPFFGIVPVIMTEDGQEITDEREGFLCFRQPWPGIMRTVYGDHARYESTYFERFPGLYFTGDGGFRDSEGYIWVTGRIDDMLNVSGHLMSTAQVESSLVEHPSVSEAAVVARPHPVKGQCLHCFVTLKEGVEFMEGVVNDLRQQVRQCIGAFASPDYIQNAPALPKTRSGKIMRRVLRKIAANERDLGDVSTMADSSVVDMLFQLRPN